MSRATLEIGAARRYKNHALKQMLEATQKWLILIEVHLIIPGFSTVYLHLVRNS